METLVIYNQSQTLEGNLTDYSGPVPMRAVIRRNAYDHQSYGAAQAWTPNGWTDIQRFPINHFAIEGRSYVSPDGAWEHIMENDLLSLIGYAKNHMAHC